MIAPTSGSVDYGSTSVNAMGEFAFNTMATYVCNEGFALTAVVPPSTCTGNGMTVNGNFDLDTPTCERECMRIYIPHMHHCFNHHIYYTI